MEAVREPPRLKASPTPARNVPCSPNVVTAFDETSKSWVKLPFSGRSVICFSLMSWPMVVLSVSSATPLAVTSTISVISPKFRTKSTRATCSTSSLTPDLLAVLKPVIFAVIR